MCFCNLGICYSVLWHTEADPSRESDGVLPSGPSSPSSCPGLVMQASLLALQVPGPRPRFSAPVQRVFFCRVLGVRLFFCLGTILFKTGDRGIPVCEHSLSSHECVFLRISTIFFNFLFWKDYKFIASYRNSTERVRGPFTQFPPVPTSQRMSPRRFLGWLLRSGQGFLGSSPWRSVPIALGWELPRWEDVIKWWDSCPRSAIIFLIWRHLTHRSLISL